MKASITLLGRLGADPERKGEVVRVRMATDRRAKVDGEWGKVSTWWQVTVFGKQAEFCERFLQKGAVILVEGEIGARDYTDKDGNKRQAYDVIANAVTSVSKAPEQGDRYAASPKAAPAVSNDIPF
jgi:single-strand DNA-binding protein